MRAAAATLTAMTKTSGVLSYSINTSNGNVLGTPSGIFFINLYCTIIHQNNILYSCTNALAKGLGIPTKSDFNQIFIPVIKHRAGRNSKPFGK
eukprot:SAG11_NODE_21424_length_425_cov_0.944785_1_plen_92_part_10